MRRTNDRKSQVLPYARPLPVVLDCAPNIMPDASASGFHTTSWTLVQAAAVYRNSDSSQALAALCQSYWNPVYAFIRRNGYDQDQAQDLSQEFFARLLEKNILVH